MTNTTYTVLTKDGEVIARGLNLFEAAHKMLIRNGHNYKIDGQRLMVSRNGNNAENYAEWPDYDSEGQGEGAIWGKVVRLGGVCGTSAIEDAEFDAILLQEQG